MTQNETESEHSLVPIKQQSALVMPVTTVEAIKEAFDRFQELKGRLLVKEDYAVISGKPFVRKSGWRKLGAAFGISDDIIEEIREFRPDGSFIWRIKAKAIASNGRYTTGIGACDSREITAKRNSWIENDTYTRAHTRAKNRAISDLIGGGEVSAEEMDTDYELIDQQPAGLPASSPTRRVTIKKTSTTNGIIRSD